MAQFTIEIRESLSLEVTVEAETAQEAVEQVEERYRAGEIVLDASHFQDTEFNDVTEETDKTPCFDFTQQLHRP